jgi:hypothetical protein
VPRWVETDSWKCIDEKWGKECGGGLFPHRFVAYKGIGIGCNVMGCHYKSPMCTFLVWIDKSNSPSIFHTLVSMGGWPRRTKVRCSRKSFRWPSRNQGRKRDNISTQLS